MEFVTISTDSYHVSKLNFSGTAKAVGGGGGILFPYILHYGAMCDI